MSFLYSITLYPLVWGYQKVYLFCVAISGSYVFSLFLLAIISTIIYTPLKKMAARQQQKERFIQQIIHPQIDKIKSECHGAQRHQRISRLYQRYAYHPIYALRSMYGVALQIPFLCAAYYMLSDLPELAHQSFWLIQDLKQPDQLLAGLNLLPILMTMFNILAILSTPYLARKEQIQAFIIALVFLLLLYHAPAALMIYWTCNNALLCLQNMIAEKNNPQLTKIVRLWINRRQAAPKVKVSLRQRVNLFFIWSTIILASLSLLICLNLTSSQSLESFTEFTEIIFYTLLPLYLLVIYNKYVFKIYDRLFLVCLSWVLPLSIIIIAYTINLIRYNIYNIELFFSIRHNDCVNFFYIPLMVGWFILFTTLLSSTSFALINKFVSYRKLIRLLFISTWCLIGLIIFNYAPVTFYSSAPEEFSLSLTSTLLNLMPYLLGWCLFGILCSYLPFNLLVIFTILSLFICLQMLLSSFVFIGNYGSLDKLILSNQNYFAHIETIIFDAINILISCLIIYAIFKTRYFEQSCKITYFISCSLIIFCFYNVTIIRSSTTSQITSDKSEQQHIIKQLYSFSKTESNVLIFFLDGFTGGHMYNILREDPSLEQRLSGFTWYPDSVSIGRSTMISSPSIYGGYAFLPEKMNEDRNRLMTDKIAEAFSILPNHFAKQGYAIGMLESPFPFEKKQLLKYLNKEMELALLETIPPSFAYRWAKKINIDIAVGDLSNYLMAISLFKVAPHGLKRKIYRQWNWFGAGNNLFTNKSFYDTLANTSVFGLLPELADNKNNKPTFKYFYSMLAHLPWHLPKIGYAPIEKPVVEENELAPIDNLSSPHMYTENHNIQLLVNFFEWMQQHHIYDNSLIILISDHDFGDSQQIAFPEFVGESKPRPHSLFMVKPINAKGNLNISSDLVSSADVVKFACEAISGCPGIEPFHADPQKTRLHYSYKGRVEHFKGTTAEYEKFIVTGSMFNKDNWQHLK